MAIQLSVAVRNAMLDSIEASIGVSPKLRLRAGAAPANAAAASQGAIIAELTLPADWMANAANGTKGLSGAWQDPSADNAGTVGHFEIVAADNVTRHLQGTVTNTGGGGDITLDNVNVNAGQAVSITSFTLTAPNA